MSTFDAAILETRGLLALAGPDRLRFLQGLVTNDVMPVAPDRAVHAALLTPQGKVLFDLFLVGRDEDALWIESEAARLDDLRARLSKFRLRSKITLTRADDMCVAVAWGEGAPAAFGLPAQAGAARPVAEGAGVAFVDPRLPAGGVRLALAADRAADILTAQGATLREPVAFDRHRLPLGLPDGSRDLIVEKTTALEGGFEDLAGVDFSKGCYMGQELTARTKYRGLLKRRLMPVVVEDGPLPEPGAPLLTEAGKDGGEMRSGVAMDDGTAVGLAIVRLEAMAAGTPLSAGASRLRPVQPPWMTLPATAGDGAAAG